MTANAKNLLHGLTPDQLNHPSVQRIIDTLLEEYYRTGYGITVIRWIEESYNLTLIH